MSTTEPNTTTDDTPVSPEVLAALAGTLRAVGATDPADQLDQLVQQLANGELTAAEAGAQAEAIGAELAGILADAEPLPADPAGFSLSLPVPEGFQPFDPTLATDDGAQLAQLAQLASEDDEPEEAPQEALVSIPPPSGDAAARLAQVLAEAGMEGRYVVLTPQEALDLADLAAFAGYAREAVYPVIVALQPLVQRLGAMGDQLQTAGPAGVLSLLAGSFSQK